MYKFDNIGDGYSTVSGLTSELESIYINFIYENNTSNLLVVTSTIYEANKLYNSLINYNPNIYLYLSDDLIMISDEVSSPEFETTRLETLNNITKNKDKKIVITNLNGLLRFLPTKKSFIEHTINIKKGIEINKDELYRNLTNIGYIREDLVTKTGEVSNRGYILDIFPINEDNAIRIEFFGDEIESIRYFDINTQLSIKEIDEININPSSEFITDKDVEKRSQKDLYKYENVSKLNEYLDNPILIYDDYNRIYNSYLLLCDDINKLNESKNTNDKFIHDLDSIHEDKTIYILGVDNILPNIKVNNKYKYDCYDVENFDDNTKMLNEYINKWLSNNKTVVICMHNESQIKNISKYIDTNVKVTTFDKLYNNKVNLVIKNINNGYIFKDYVVLSEKNIFKNVSIKSTFKSKYKYGTKISSIDALKVGDYVVHDTHGIGIYGGIVTLNNRGIVKDYLLVNYRDNGKIYIPVEKIELISKYSSNEGKSPRIDKLGSTEWQKTKLRVRNRLKNIAEDLIKVAAERKTKVGYAFNKDTVEQQVFENEFDYEETSDQIKATNTIKENMEKPYPMDLLLCGDVGYGKTEVAFRAIFKAICSNKQVAYLCPTTILSNQQYISALERFSSFPINIALMNRFTTKKEQKEILTKLKEGKIDLLFGTHRILSDDIEFKDLGLLIVDEEQRFGVTHKEKIKKYKSNIDVLTLSATPIPRTLQMSLVGIRDLALIETPPSNRYPVQTYVLPENDLVIKDAIYKELSRHGQVFILCNKIESFDDKKKKISDLIPEARIGYAHGKMDKTEIEDTMIKFVNKEFDVLLCTTIIETGIDIQNANTLIILDADKFGLSQLYQIRGRVGRTDRVAYAYLMYEKNKILSEIATKRLSAIKEFAELGSGFKIAMRDLSIRGAGDVLGVEQSGFIDDIGIDLYLKMLNEEVDRINGIEPKEVENDISLDVTTHISDSYVSEDELKITIHKLINQIDSFDSLKRIKTEIEDRFGKIDESLNIYMYEELFESMRKLKGIEKVSQDEKTIKLIFNADMTNNIKTDELFIEAYKVSKNFKLSYEYKRLVLTLNIQNLDKHWIYYIVEILTHINW